MKGRWRFSLAMAIGLVLAADAFILILRSTEPAVAATRDVPILQVAPTTSTTIATTIAPATPETTAAPARARPASVPANPYQPEPVRQIGTIEIPKIGLVHPVFEGITMRNIDRGPSHWPGTALPGTVGNAVFAGHRVTHSHPFRRIDELVEGDQVIFTVADVRSVYTVTGHEVVVPTALHIVEPTPTPTATLFACHPPGSARYRYVVRLALLADG